jgi:hypothetical protein
MHGVEILDSLGWVSMGLCLAVELFEANDFVCTADGNNILCGKLMSIPIL